MLNQASFYGYIAFDVALRTTSGGREYVNNALNVRRNFKGNDGKYGYDSIPFSIFGPQARVFAEHCKKEIPLFSAEICSLIWKRFRSWITASQRARQLIGSV